MGPARITDGAGVFNNVNYGQPNGTFGAATFGRISATSLTHPNMRQMQLGFKLIF